MKRSFLVLTSFLFVLSASSQSTENVIASAGGFNQITGLSISWTLGETIIPTYENLTAGLILTHGFQHELLITTIEENIETPVTVTVYPNPASDIMNIAFKEALDKEVRLTLINSQGKPVKEQIIEATTIEWQVNMQDLPAGIYHLKLTKGKHSNVYKVVKL